MTRARRIVWIAILMVIFVTVPDVYAHRPEPGNKEGVTRILNPSTSYAYYREIVAPEQVHVYEFEAKAEQFFHAGINVPQLKGLEDFGVTIALLGPGLPPILEHQLGFNSAGNDGNSDAIPSREFFVLDALIADLGSGVNGGVVVESVKSKDFFEPFTQTRYWGRQELELNLPESGTYHLLVWNPNGKTGKYVLDTGTQEAFSPGDLLRFPLWWLNARVYFEQTPQLICGSLALLSGVFALVVYLRR